MITQGRCLQRFTKAAEDVKVLKATPTDDELLEVYALYKQATVGDVNTVKPRFIMFFGDLKKKKDGYDKIINAGAYVG
ncbi:unnamed protein product [Timema podura]|uniref:ACB domain-containing protein n=1 Tax=Timema podura TaxID=61482 RepID=A0ABN7PJN5_TIMPD|nr:unnamed protein product [Timema podura]